MKCTYKCVINKNNQKTVILAYPGPYTATFMEYVLHNTIV